MTITLKGNVWGALLGLGVVLCAILLNVTQGIPFFSLEGILIVVGGSFAYALMSYPTDQLKKGLRAIPGMFAEVTPLHKQIQFDIRRFISWSYFIQAKGIKEFEKAVGSKTDDPLLNYGIELVVSGYKPEDVKMMMETAAEANYERSIKPVEILRNMASSAPAFGMVGTLVGMILMLGNLESDMSKIGTGMGIAMLTTLYGLLLARLVFLPAADSLMFKEDQNRFRNFLVAEGMSLLLQNQNARFIQDVFNSYIDPEHHENLDILRDRPNEPII